MDRTHGTTPASTRRAAGRALVLGSLLLSAGMAGCLGDQAAPGTGQGQGPDADGAPTWEALADLPTPRTEVAAVVSDGELVVLGGFEADNVQSAVVEALDLEEGTWRELAPLPMPLHHLAAVDHGGTLHVLGGHMGIPFVPTSMHLVLEPGAAMWTVADPLPTPRHGLGVAGHGGMLYAAAGGPEPGLTVSDAVERLPLDPPGTRR